MLYPPPATPLTSVPTNTNLLLKFNCLLPVPPLPSTSQPFLTPSKGPISLSPASPSRNPTNAAYWETSTSRRVSTSRRAEAQTGPHSRPPFSRAKGAPQRSWINWAGPPLSSQWTWRVQVSSSSTSDSCSHNYLHSRITSITQVCTQYHARYRPLHYGYRAHKIVVPTKWKYA